MSEATPAPCTKRDVLAALNAACRPFGGQAKLARKAGVSTAYINMVVKHRRELTEPIANALGFMQTISYQRIAS